MNNCTYKHIIPDKSGIFETVEDASDYIVERIRTK